MTDTDRQPSIRDDDTSPQEEEQLRLPTGAIPSTMTDVELAALVEALLLVAHEPPTIDELAAGAEVPADEIERALEWLGQQDNRGWMIQRHGRHIHLVTAPRFAARIRTFLGLDREARLTAASLEALAIVAYQQPVTRSEIDRVRGVDSSGVLAKLHARGLIEPVARLATVGNPIQYGTTADFLKHFGLGSLDDLPPLGEIDGKDGRALLDAALASNTADEHDADPETIVDPVTEDPA